MAWKKQFRCKQCGYEADVYEGRGFMGQHISTMTCPDCHSLQPLVVGGVIGDAAPSSVPRWDACASSVDQTASVSGTAIPAPVVEAGWRRQDNGIFGLDKDLRLC